MATVGRVIVWMCMSTGVGCLIYALHILFSWPEPPPNPLDTSALSINTIAASVVAWGGLALIAVALLVGHFVWQSDDE
jgi:hypothetical protein